MNAVAKNFARVIIPSPVKEPLTYAVPAALREDLAVGMRVLIPLGKRKVIGIVYELLASTSVANIREIIATQDERAVLDPELIRLCEWIAQYYVASLGEVLTTILPPAMRQESKRIVSARRGTFAVGSGLENEIFAILSQKNDNLSVKYLTRKLPGAATYKALKRLEALGAVEIRERLPDPKRQKKTLLQGSGSASTERPPELSLSQQQKTALAAIEERIAQRGFETFLLHGVTGSGKTEVYLRAMERVRQAGRRSLILIPEISLTPQLIDRLNARFPGRVGILHSGLTGAERWAHWWRVAGGDVDVIVGARSAVFAPAPDLGLIVVDEEHDPSYKQDEGLRYNGRDLAVVRAKLLGCPVILGSATPAIESYANALQGRYRLLTMTQRVQQRPLPRIEIVDLRSETPDADPLDPGESGLPRSVEAHQKIRRSLVSRRLRELLRDNFVKSRQSLIFLNRRGFSNFLQCGLCGYVIRCTYCSVTLTLHLKRRILSCHHCNFRRAQTALCPACGNSSLAGVGAGTEQIEKTLQHLLPQARIARMDRDTTSRRGSHERLIRAWEKGELDVLVGTQMITKGHDVAGVTLVGVLLADASLNLPDFRATERTFQILSQVAGRSGRGAEPGTVVVQTYAPDHYVIQHLIDHDYARFFAAEIEFRRALNYPPFGRLIQLRLDGPDGERVETTAKNLALALRAMLGKDPAWREEIEVLGPAPAPIPRLQNRYRWQILLKAKRISALHQLAVYARESVPRAQTVRLHIDVDPHSML
jgi:primosomal protein N' (replication factor Y) (superfamily II helicase)